MAPSKIIANRIALFVRCIPTGAQSNRRASPWAVNRLKVNSVEHAIQEFCQEGGSDNHRFKYLQIQPVLRLECRLGCSQARDRYSKRRTAHIVQSHVMTKFDRSGISPVFSTDPDF